MQCKCCMQNVKDGMARCNICGFPMMSNNSVGVDEVAVQFREKRLNGVSVSVKFHYYL